MKKILSYIIMSMLFFNVLFIFYYYFKISSFLYVDLFNFNIITNTVLINLILAIINLLYIFIYKIFNLYKLSYFEVVMFGLVIGIIGSLLLLGIENYEIGDYLSIISYFIINILFISYSLNFEKTKIVVFE